MDIVPLKSKEITTDDKDSIITQLLTRALG